MARPKRIDLPFCLYHVFSRTNSGDVAFESRSEEEMFLYYLARYSRLLSMRIHAYCLMHNHFHLLVESGQIAALSEFMRRLLTSFTVNINRDRQRHGHLFQGRFKSLIVDKSGYFLTVARYIHLNPAGVDSDLDPVKYPGSSLKFYVNGGEPEFLHTREILVWFDGDREKHLDFVMEGLTEETAPPILQQRYIGNLEFARRTGKRIGIIGKRWKQTREADFRRNQYFEEIENAKAEMIVDMIAEHFNQAPETLKSGRQYKGVGARARKALIFLLLENVSWSHKKIAEYLNINYVNAISWHLNSLKNTPDLLDEIQPLQLEIIKENRSV